MKILRMEESTLKKENDLSLNHLNDLPQDEEVYASSHFDLEATERAFKALEEKLRQYSEHHNLPTQVPTAIPFPKVVEQEEQAGHFEVQTPNQVKEEKNKPSMLQHLTKGDSVKLRQQKEIEDEMALRHLMATSMSSPEKPFWEEPESPLPKIYPSEPLKAEQKENENRLTMPLNLDTVEASAKAVKYHSVADTIKSLETEANLPQSEVEAPKSLEARQSIPVEQAQSLSHVKPFRVSKVASNQEASNSQDSKKKKHKNKNSLERDLLSLMLEKNAQKRLEQEKQTSEQVQDFESVSVQEADVLVNTNAEEILTPIEMSEAQKEQVKHLFDGKERKENENILEEISRAKKRKLFGFILSSVVVLGIISVGVYAYWTYYQGEQSLNTLTKEVQDFQSEVLGAETYAKALPILEALSVQKQRVFFQKEKFNELQTKLEAELVERQNTVLQQLEQNAKEISQLILKADEVMPSQLNEVNEKNKLYFEEYQKLGTYAQNTSQAVEQWLFSMQKNTYQAFSWLSAAQKDYLKLYQETNEKTKAFAEPLLKDLDTFKEQNLESVFLSLAKARQKSAVDQVQSLTTRIKEKMALFSEATQKYLGALEQENAHFEQEVLLKKAIEAEQLGKVERANRIFAQLEKGELSETFTKQERFIKLKESLAASHVSLKATTESPVLNFQVKPLMADLTAAKYSANYRQFTNHHLTSNAFIGFLKALYDADYVLVNGEDAFDPLGVYWGYQLPEGKKPLILDLQDITLLNRASDGAYFADQMRVSENGKLTATTRQGKENDNNLVLQLEKFIQEHPDFSFDGARANIQAQEKDQVFGLSLKEEEGQNLLKHLYKQGYRLSILASQYGTSKNQILEKLTEESLSLDEDFEKIRTVALFEPSVYAQLTEEDKNQLAGLHIKSLQIRENKVAYKPSEYYVFEQVMDMRPYMLYKKEYDAYFDSWALYQLLIQDGHYVSAK